MQASTSRALALASICIRPSTGYQTCLVRGNVATGSFTQRRHACGLLAADGAVNRPQHAAGNYGKTTSKPRWLNTLSKSFESPLKGLKDTETSTLVYVSTTTDPYHNLSLEHYLLTYSPPGSRVLFLYTNSPCVVIGRNQNPWVECNLRGIMRGLPALSNGKPPPEHLPHNRGKQRPQADLSNVSVDIIRRRSGGGTVVHGPGNLNYCTITPNDKAFNRRTHAEMVVGALHSLQSSKSFRSQYPDFGANDAKVNERHDIVMLDPFSKKEGEKWLKVSGSAFKLTRQRALHHGTLLLSSPYLRLISGLLASPGKPFLKTKGVESVRSPVGNLYGNALDDGRREMLDTEVRRAVVAEFSKMYSQGADVEAMKIGDADVHALEEVRRGVEELKSREWKGGQTPRFTFGYTSERTDTRLEMEFARGKLEKIGVGFDGSEREILTVDVPQGREGAIGQEVFEWKDHDIWKVEVWSAVEAAIKAEEEDGQLKWEPNRARVLEKLTDSILCNCEFGNVVAETLPKWLPDPLRWDDWRAEDR